MILVTAFATKRASSAATPKEVAVRAISLTGEINDPDAEISGLAWYKDHLILLPQYPNYPDRGADGRVFAIAKKAITEYLTNDSPAPITPLQIPFVAPDWRNDITGYEGYEAIAFARNHVYLTIEAGKSGDGYLVSADILSDLSELKVHHTTGPKIESQSGVGNMAEETILMSDQGVLTIHEANGADLSLNPQAHFFSYELQSRGTIAFPSIPYRITDATELDANNRFWTINYFYPGDTELQTTNTPLFDKFGTGTTHNQSDQVERLVEMHYSTTGITLTETPPIQLELDHAQYRNWEGIVRLDGRGFLLVTDRYPETMLVFVPTI